MEVERSCAIGCPPWLCSKAFPSRAACALYDIVRCQRVRPAGTGPVASALSSLPTLDGLEGERFPSKSRRGVGCTGPQAQWRNVLLRVPGGGSRDISRLSNLKPMMVDGKAKASRTLEDGLSRRQPIETSGEVTGRRNIIPAKPLTCRTTGRRLRTAPVADSQRLTPAVQNMRSRG